MPLLLLLLPLASQILGWNLLFIRRPNRLACIPLLLCLLLPLAARGFGRCGRGSSRSLSVAPTLTAPCLAVPALAAAQATGVGTQVLQGQRMRAQQTDRQASGQVSCHSAACAPFQRSLQATHVSQPCSPPPHPSWLLLTSEIV